MVLHCAQNVAPIGVKSVPIQIHKKAASMKIIHTSDWHLGHQLHGYDREYEHQAFLDWLAETLEREQADALLVSGDIFDTANPPASAWQMLYRFLARMAKALPDMDVVITGGNHDSPSKLDAPHELLKAFDLHMVGGIRRLPDGSLDIERMLIPVSDKSGETAAWVMAVPFLRSSDLRTQHLDEVDDRLIAGVRELYREVYEAAKTRLEPGQALVAMGHCYMASGSLSEMSERRILGGNQHALPADIFQDDITYVALGHLHLAQQVAKQSRIRYSGSPIPLSLSERHYHHQVLSVELNGGELAEVHPLEIPRTVELMRVPEKAAPLDDVLKALKSLKLEELPREQQPLVEVALLLDQPQPMLREKILKAIKDKPLRLARIATRYTCEVSDNPMENRRLEEVTPEQVFTYGWQRKFEGAPDEAMMKAFEQLMVEAETAEEQDV